MLCYILSNNNNGFFFYFYFTDPNKPHIIGQRKVVIKNADGTTKIIQQNIPAPQPKAVAVQAASSSTSTASNSSTGTDSGIASSPNGGGAQKVQIIRGPDGKVSVRGLNPGQQLIQMSDGKLHVLTTNQSGGHTKTVLKSNAPGTPKLVTAATPNKSIVIPHQQRQQALVTAALSKTPVVIRQQLAKASAAIAKVTPKSQNSQRVSLKWITITSTND